MPRPTRPDHMVSGPFTLKGSKLTFNTENAHLGYDARRAMETGADFPLTLTPLEGVKTIAGKVQSVELVGKHRWKIVMVQVRETD